MMSRKNIISFVVLLNIIYSFYFFPLLYHHFKVWDGHLFSDIPFILGCLNLAIIFLLFITAYGLWKRRKWGFYLILIESILCLLSSFPTLFIAPFYEGEIPFPILRNNIFLVLIEIAKLIFFLLPKTRKSFSN